MTTGFAAVPEAPRFVLANATIPAVLLDMAPDAPDADGLVRADIVVDGGHVAMVGPPGSGRDLPLLDLDQGMVFPTFVDMHTHLDKGHTVHRRPNPDGTFAAAIAAVEADRRANWSAADLRRRMEFSLRSAHAHGTSLLRTHLDSSAPQHAISWPVFMEMKERWAGRVDLQAVSILPLDELADGAFAAELLRFVVAAEGVLGAFIVPGQALHGQLDAAMRLAESEGLDLDFHVDETGDPAADGLLHIAEAAIRNRFPGRIVAGHCCSLAVQPPDVAARKMERVAEAGIAIVSLPMCNMYLQDRVAGRTPRWRGVTLLHELMANGVDVAVASDNTRDPFYAYGDLDMVEVFREAVRILHLDHPVGAWPAAVARTPAKILRRDDHGVIAAGRAADLVLFRARSFDELLARPQADRTVLRGGKAIDATPPDYRELDDVAGAG